ncbi:AAA family ATPase [Flavobacterium zepuense]|uniref:AAA family ATPase n=1 Tax=Flavobacterium zepuense TaxID=2593302 RepID=A0A552UTI0_9FLAO|nr:AAA family ATPase [Flavobacterium zepuense]TRW21542.1 AAA family ATPase [Flavobacterium zepuense]
MPKSEQVLKKIEIQKLKNLIDLTIDFTEHPLTAILGPNGSGKSTILHALSCVNNPVNIPFPTINHRLSEFFTPTTHSVWTGSSFDITQDYRDGQNVTSNHLTRFRKQNERWSPRYVTRIERYVSFIGIRTCVPRIESETQRARIQFNTTPLNDNISTRVRLLAGEIMDRNYTSYNEHRAGAGKRYIGVSIAGIDYSSLSMGAGEQRIFYILSEAIKAPNYGLIIIDEIDLLLHQDALFRLIEKLNIIAVQKHLQIIFTTHAQSLLTLNNVAFRHLFQTPLKTLCFNKTKPDALQRLTGHQIRPLEVFVEDDLAYTLVKKICSEEGLSKYVSIKEFGAAINCFTSASGAILNNLDNQNNMLFVLDGDEYSTDDEKNDKIGRVLTGTTHVNNVQRQTAFNRITQFVLPNNTKPERFYHHLICNLGDQNLSVEQLEIVQVARQIGNPGDAHKYFDDIIIRMDFTRDVGLSKLVDLVSLTSEWPAIKSNIKLWLDSKREEVIEQ